jgi:hypothetical protein
MVSKTYKISSRHGIAELLVKMVLNTNQLINQIQHILCYVFVLFNSGAFGRYLSGRLREEQGRFYIVNIAILLS